jgi:hypothetical protein
VNQYTDDEIIDECRRLWPSAEPYNWGGQTPAFQVERIGNVIKLTVGAMYSDDMLGTESPKPDLSKRLELSKFFNTMMVELEGEFHDSGCETSEYGGAHGFVLMVSPGQPYDDSIRIALEKMPS